MGSNRGDAPRRRLSLPPRRVRSIKRRGSGAARNAAEAGFSLIEVMMAILVIAIVMVSMVTVLVNSLVDVAYNRQRDQAVDIANQMIEEVRGLGWTTIQVGMNPSDTTLAPSVDPNLYQPPGTTTYCFEGQPLDENGVIGAQSSCVPVAWGDPACLTSGPVVSLPTASTIASPAPLSPHQQCFNAGGHTYGVDVYLTGGPGSPAVPPLTATVVVSWARPIRGGLSDHIVTTTQLSSCLTVGANCT